ncbi:nuclear transport factor 2 family protein [Pseudomonas sp. MAG733B]|uniref:nuclear transport factor 2 family protein n=1 Tax=Pseudomonas sp. MAG733B TaxID=3122079 RepID=UPI0030CA9AF0
MLDEPSITAVISALEEERYLAMRQGDLQTFERLSHPELIYIHSNGVKDSLDSYLNKCREGLYVYHRIDYRLEEVRLSGNTALAFGKMSADITSHGIDKTIHNRTLTVWLKTGLQWQLFAYQPTPMAKPSAL